MSEANDTTTKQSEFRTAMEDKQFLEIPKVSDVVKGIVIAVGKNEVRIDVANYRTGVVRGREIIDPSREYSDVEIGDEIEATVIELENENGDVELSFRFAGHRKAWDNLAELFRNGESIPARITEASKGGLLIRLNHIPGFLPVSQLAPENYPRVTGGDKGKILDKLKKFVGHDMDVRVIDVNESEEKLIVSEKAIWEEKQKNVISKYSLGDIVEGEVSALADFGAFIKFDILEGLVHISEIAWQRIDHPKNLLNVGDNVRAEIIGIESSKIFLSMKKLIDDPWKDVGDRYRIGQKVTGEVLKVNPFGFFVELDPEIHGLAHISELSHKPVDDPHALATVGQMMDFIIVSIEPEQHRLGLSLKALEDEPIEDDARGAEGAEAGEGAEEKTDTSESESVEEPPSAEAAGGEKEKEKEAPAETTEDKEEPPSAEAAGGEEKKKE